MVQIPETKAHQSLVAKYWLEDQKMAEKEMSLYDLGREIQDNGGWEEFYQKFKTLNYTMYDYHKSRRLKLQAEYNERKRNDSALHHTTCLGNSLYDLNRQT